MSVFTLLAQQAPAPTNCDDIGAAGLDLSKCFLLNETGETVANVYGTPASLVNVIVRNSFIAAGIVILFLLIFAGFKFIQSGTKGKDEARTILEVALKGIIMMFAAYWILQILEIVTSQELLVL